ncbi:hypothetical protein B0H11DRAFT_604458 [Mycena galericulata]|nr:hypothetical protein B0H11DRAFT_604458 [Mycena galericulata]
MAPKYRTPAVVRAHSRSSSATKLPVNLQFTQKKAPTRQKQQQQQQQQPHQPKQRAGFHIASPGEEEEEEDWVSSESGAVTPNPHNDNDDSDLDSGGSNDRVPGTPSATPRRVPDPVVTPRITETDLQRVPTARKAPDGADLQRVATARPADQTAVEQTKKPPARNGTIDTRLDPQTLPDSRTFPSEHGSRTPNSRPVPDTAPPSPSRRRTSRPMSTHSITRPELRPHPLIRGQSYGQPALTPKPSPLLPVAVTREAEVTGQLTTTPSTSPTSPFPASSVLGRRPSVSSTRSVATVATPLPPPRAPRHRTFSTLSTASSSAALSSLTHLPTVSRPPTPQMIAFFPPAHPHGVRVEDIHPLLPPPYIHNHLTVVARRAPIHEAFDRVIRARQSARS